MISISVGLLLIIILFGVIYFIKDRKSKPPPIPSKEIKENDIVLTYISDTEEYGIMWNGIPGKNYSYSIKSGGNTVASGSLESKSSVFKMKGIKLEKNKTYDVTVHDTSITVFFNYITISNIQRSDFSFECEFDLQPSNVEIVSNGKLLPLSKSKFKLNPPGIICDTENTTYHIVVYNGPNVITLLNLTPIQHL